MSIKIVLFESERSPNMTEKEKKPIINDLMVLREEFDDWAVVFNPDTGEAFGLNPTSVFIWKLMNGQKTINEIIKEVQDKCTNVPQEVEEHIKNFIEELEKQGIVGYEINNN